MREFEYLSDGSASVEGEGHRYRPWGFKGGEDGQPAMLQLVHADGDIEDLPSKVPHRRIKAGELFRCVGPAGGGYGPASARDPKAVAADVADGLISKETAQKHYGLDVSKEE